ncbi:MAG TPA: 2TM domain-containing protein [Solirubrobacterales bacterium]|nr:2TM domain-containing protein [Solirubrobacterales bacterium]HEU4803829.1 2TM domain-containing protein [Solirubrobacterales bacterium]
MNESGESDAREQALRRLKAQRAFRSLLVTAAGILAVMVAIWAISGGGYFWPIWVVFGLGIALVTTAWQAYGPRERGISEDEIRREMERQR